MALVECVYATTAAFPKEELYGLTSQMRRCAVSIPSNIAEGYTRKSRPEYLQFLRIAFGSGAELETQLEIARRLGYISAEQENEMEEKLTEVMKMLNKLISTLTS